MQAISSDEGKAAIVSASIHDPYIAIRRADGSCSFFAGEPVSRTITETEIPEIVSPGLVMTDYQGASIQAIEVFTDDTGIYRSFEGQAQAQAQTQADSQPPTANGSTSRPAGRQGQAAKIQLTPDQVLRLQNEKPAISAEEPSIQNAMNASQGSHWLAVVTDRGLLQVGLQMT